MAQVGDSSTLGAMQRLPVHHLRRVHGWLTVVWVVLVVPTMLWWRESIMWVSLMSIYAIIVSHAGAWQASRAEEVANNTETPHQDGGGSP